MILVGLGGLCMILAAVLALAPSLSASIWGVFYGSQANAALSLTRYAICFTAPMASAVLLYVGAVRFALGSSPPSHTWRAGRTQLGTAAGCVLWCVASGTCLCALLAIAGFAG